MDAAVKTSSTLDRRSLAFLLAAFFFGWAVFMMNASVLPPLYPAIGREFQLTAAQQGMISSALWLPYAVLQIPMGMVGDRLGPRRLLLATLTLAAVALILVGAAATSYLLLLCFMALVGIGLSAYYPAANGLTVTLVPPSWRGISSAVVMAGLPVGMIAGLLLASTISSAPENWRLAFLLLAIPGVLMVLALAATVPDVRSPSFGLKQLVATLRHRDLLLVDAANFCSTYGFWVVVNWVPSFLVRERGLPVTAAPLFLVILAVASLPAELLAGRISDRVGRRRMTMVLFVLGGLSLLALPFAPTATGLMLVMVAYGLFGKQALDPVVITWGGDHVRQTPGLMMGAAMGAMNLFRMIPAFVAPVVSGALYDATGSFSSAFVLGAAVVLAGVFFGSRARDARP